MRALKRGMRRPLGSHGCRCQRAAAAATAMKVRMGPGGHPGNDSVASGAGSHPDTPALRPSHARTRPTATTTRRSAAHDVENSGDRPTDCLTSKEDSLWSRGHRSHIRADSLGTGPMARRSAQPTPCCCAWSGIRSTPSTHPRQAAHRRVGYAENALDWWHRRTGASDAVRADQIERLACWQLEHPHDIVRSIRTIRARHRAA